MRQLRMTVTALAAFAATAVTAVSPARAAHWIKAHRRRDTTIPGAATGTHRTHKVDRPPAWLAPAAPLAPRAAPGAGPYGNFSWERCVARKTHGQGSYRHLPGISGLYTVAQALGGFAGVWAAHLMFELPVWQISTTTWTGPGQWLAEAIASISQRRGSPKLRSPTRAVQRRTDYRGDRLMTTKELIGIWLGAMLMIAVSSFIVDLYFPSSARSNLPIALKPVGSNADTDCS
jgi:hypothetical protein